MARVLRLLRRAAALAALGALALALVAGALAFALAQGWQRERVRAAAEAALARAAGTPVRIEALEGPLVPSATARGVRVGPAAAPLATARALRLELGGLALRRGPTLLVAAVEAEGLALSLDAAALGGPASAEAEPSAPPGTEAGAEPERPWWRVRLRALRADDARLALRGLPRALVPSGEAELRAGLRLARLSLPWSEEAARRVRGRLALALEPPEGEAALRGARLELVLEEGRLRSEALSLEGPAGRAEGEAALALGLGPEAPLPGPGRLHLRFEGLDLARLTGRPELASALRGRLELDLAAPGAGRAEGGLGPLEASLELGPSELPGGALQGASLRGRVEGLGGAAPLVWALERGRVEAPGLRLDAQGRGRGAAASELRMRAEVEELARLSPWLELAFGSAPPLRGAATLALELAGPLRQPSGQVRAEGSGLRVAELALGEFRGELALLGGGEVRVETFALSGGAMPLRVEPGARLALREGELALEGLVLRSGAQRLAASGGLARGRLRELELEASALDLARLGALAGAPRPLGGTLSGALRLDGPFENARVDGELAWSEPALAGARAEGLALALATEEERIRVEGTLRAPRGASAELEGALPRDLAALAARGPLAHPGIELRLRARELDAALAAPLLPPFLREPKGRLRGELALRGGAAGPALRGRLALEGGSLAVPLLGRTFAPIEGALALEGERLRVESLRVGEPGAEGVLRGEVHLRGLRPERLDLALELRHLPVARSALVQADATGTLAARGPLDALRARGGIVLEDLELRIPEARDPALKEIRVVTGGEDGPPLREDARGPGALEGAAFDLALTVPRGSWLRGRGAALELAGVLRATKEAGEATRYSGETRALRGSWSFYGRRFELRRGVAALTGERLLDPTLDIVAEHPAGAVTVLAYVEGRASEPRIRLESEPPLPESDVLSYLLFGRPASEVAGEHQGALQSAAAQAGAGMAASELSRLLAERLPVDIVDVRFDEDGGGAVLGVGKYLSERAFVRYDKTLGSDPEDQIVVEYKLAPSWSVESELTSEGSAGADLIWHYEY